MNAEMKNKGSSAVFRSGQSDNCANCGNQRQGTSYECIVAKQTPIRYGKYIGIAYDSFVTKKVFLCDVCIGDRYRKNCPYVWQCQS